MTRLGIYNHVEGGRPTDTTEDKGSKSGNPRCSREKTYFHSQEIIHCNIKSFAVFLTRSMEASPGGQSPVDCIQESSMFMHHDDHFEDVSHHEGLPKVCIVNDVIGDASMLRF